MENPAKQAKNGVNPSFKLALAMTILQSRRRQKSSSSSATADPSSGINAAESDPIKWKRKAKQRKEEILRLKEDLKHAEG
ncbi:hypothetical protein ACJIZ3_025259 [Penstemon smallii]|uniref:Uncharacterized protein n=1 Tax=Penstemon smallii TaxID=265156 RepID=A0ABD3TWC0_9LAMI